MKNLSKTVTIGKSLRLSHTQNNSSNTDHCLFHNDKEWQFAYCNHATEGNSNDWHLKSNETDSLPCTEAMVWSDANCQNCARVEILRIPWSLTVFESNSESGYLSNRE